MSTLISAGSCATSIFFEPCKNSIRLALSRQFSASKSRVTRVAESRVDESRSLESRIARVAE